MFDIHTPTVFLAMAFSSLGLGIASWAVWKWLDRQPALLAWGAAHFLWSGGMLLLMGRGILPDSLSILVANAMILASAIGVWWGIAAFSGRPLPLMGTVALCACYAMSFPWFTWVQTDISARIIILRLLVITAFAGSFCILLRSKRRIGARLPVAIGCAGLLPMILVFAFSALGTALQYGQTSSFFQHSMVIFSSIGSLIACLAWGLATLFMVIEQRTALRQQDAAVHHFLAEQSLVGMYMIEDKSFTYVNKACADIFGYCPQVLVDSVQITDLAIPEHRERLREGLRLYAQGSLDGRRYRYHVRRRNGEIIEVEGEARLTHWQGRNVVVGVILAITPIADSATDSPKVSLAIDVPAHR